MHANTRAQHLRKDAAELRREYMQRALDESGVDPNPITQFEQWYREALTTGMLEPNAMTLATATADGKPSARIVLLKDFDERGFTFFTNYESRKGAELEQNPQAALVFWWDVMERQVRIEGQVSHVESEVSDAYFGSRPLGSRLGAWASRQSGILSSRSELEQKLAKLEAEFAARDVPRPPHWGGYRLSPDVIEFWQGRPSRLHDRIAYVRHEGGSWQIRRLSP